MRSRHTVSNRKFGWEAIDERENAYEYARRTVLDLSDASLLSLSIAIKAELERREAVAARASAAE